MQYNKIFLQTKKFESRSMHGQLPIVWEKAKDEFVYSNKKKYIDFTSTIFVSNIGHSNKNLIKSIKKTLSKPLIHTYSYLNPVRATYLKKLINFCPPYLEKAYLVSAGTEATEAGLKMMRMHGSKLSPKKIGIICFEGNWHGRTMGAQLMSSNEKQKSWIGFRDPNIYHLKFPYPDEVNEENCKTFLEKEIKNLLKKNNISLKKNIAGFMLETFQGWGAIFYPLNFVKLIEKICTENNILLCFDEMQAGFGRTGKRFGFEHYGVKPDLICVGKGMGSGFPLAGVIGRKKILDIAEIGSMSSTHSSNPVVCSAGIATIDEIENKKLVYRTEKNGNILFKKLNEIKNKYPNYISSINGRGLIAAVIFRDFKSKKPLVDLTNRICDNCLKNKLLVVKTGRESIKIGPPLIIKQKNLLKGIKIFEKSIEEALI